MHYFVFKLLLDLFHACPVLLILRRRGLKFSNREDAAARRGCGVRFNRAFALSHQINWWLIFLGNP
jgi:hypothetical protein